MSEKILDPKIGLVTVLYNGEEVLPEFFKSLGTQTYKNYVLYVIDNSPNDAALDLAKTLAKEHDVPAVFVNNNANLGVAKGNNQGIELSLESECDYVLLLNNDIDFESNVIKDMVKYVVVNNDNIIVPKIYYAGTNKIWMAGGGFNLWKGLTFHRGEKEEDTGQYNKIEYVDYSPTCFMLIRSTVFEKVGIMDESYFVYFDDTDFVWRSNVLGYRILYFPDCVINHKVSFSTGGEESEFFIYFFNRNRLKFIKKNLKGFVPVIYFLSTRFIKFLTYSSSQRKALYNSLFKPNNNF